MKKQNSLFTVLKLQPTVSCCCLKTLLHTPLHHFVLKQDDNNPGSYAVTMAHCEEMVLIQFNNHLIKLSLRVLSAE